MISHLEKPSSDVFLQCKLQTHKVEKQEQTILTSLGITLIFYAEEIAIVIGETLIQIFQENIKEHLTSYFCYLERM